ncbi:hypothetical protein M092_4241 [Parabacteroides distasonis str. 3776 D15 iv]|nr:hypothetical protein M092_4241 [Parabacteroides distasonis str. 3776 D15 iv]
MGKVDAIVGQPGNTLSKLSISVKRSLPGGGVEDFIEPQNTREIIITTPIRMDIPLSNRFISLI